MRAGHCKASVLMRALWGSEQRSTGGSHSLLLPMWVAWRAQGAHSEAPRPSHGLATLHRSLLFPQQPGPGAWGLTVARTTSILYSADKALSQRTEQDVEPEGTGFPIEPPADGRQAQAASPSPEPLSAGLGPCRHTTPSLHLAQCLPACCPRGLLAAPELGLHSGL